MSGISSSMMGDNSRDQNDDTFVRDLDPGYYVIRKRDGGPLGVGFRGDSIYPWTIVGSDDIFPDSEIHEVVRELDLEA